MKKILLTILFAGLFADVFGCLILFITDGKTVLIGNHEDWYADDAEVTFLPASGKKYGMLYFDFASEKTAQGGINTAGLFFDGTRTPFAPYNDNDSKEDCKCYIWKKILEECATVDDAIRYVEKYKIPEIEDIHVLFADKKGHSVVIGVYDGKLQLHKRSNTYQLVTNFNLTNPSYGDEQPCLRFATAEKMLAADSSVTLNNIEKILAKTHQDKLTVYSNIYNLTSGEVYIYNHADFSRKVKLNLSAELKKGKHSVKMDALFK
ncbi:MAG: linear amide C-N hydrolase [Bacteroidetes bacterium]|nr:linear amide C-N hydrolase [Bacteroidota bacterium]